ncbi:uncharacterized protein LOC144709729 [Wolffia australiana]
MATTMTLCAQTSPIKRASTRLNSPLTGLFQNCTLGKTPQQSLKLLVLAKRTEAEEPLPSWAKTDSNEPPPWAREDGAASVKTTKELPFFVYLLSSAITAIAAIGSIFEYVNEKPVFGVIQPDSAFYAPLLGFFVFTGIPVSGFLWFKSVQAANKEAEEQDRRDGY